MRKIRFVPRTLAVAAGFAAIFVFSAFSQRRAADAIFIAVSPSGSDSATGTVERPFQTLERAMQAVRGANADHDVTVRLAEGVYRLKHPLLFTALDGGRGGTMCRGLLRRELVL